MKTYNLFQRFFVLSACVLVVGCSGTTTRTLGEHVFAVPFANNVSVSDTPFLPRPDPADGFSFTLNPTAPLEDQILVNVALRDRLCRRAAGTKALVNSGVCAPQGFEWRGRSLQKVGDAVFWNYVVAVDQSPHGRLTNAVLISCFQLTDTTRQGLCTASFPYSDFVLSLHLTDNNVPKVEALYDAAANKLRAWDRGRRTGS